MINRKAYLNKEHHFAVRSEEMPAVNDNEVLVHIMVNGICGSDVHFFKEGRLGNYVVDEPYVPGHECSGIIEQVGKNVANVAVGDHVVIEPGMPCGHCPLCRSGRYNQCPQVIFLSVPGINGTFCDYIAVRSDAVHRMPSGMSFKAAALAEPAAVGIHAVNRCGNVTGKTGVIFGAGPIGLMTAQAFKAAGGAKTCLLDINQNRLKMAGSFQIDELIDLTRVSADDLSDLGECVFETAGSPAATKMLFAAARSAGSVVQVGWPAGNIVDLDIALFIEKELDYKSVNRYANTFPTAIQYLADGRIKADQMITKEYAFGEIEEAFHYTASHPDETIKTIVVQ